MGQDRKPLIRAGQELQSAGEYPRLSRYEPPAAPRAYPVITAPPHVPFPAGQTSRSTTGIANKPEIAASWIVAEPLPDAQTLFTGIESARRTAQIASDWFSKLAKLIECQVHLRDGDLAQARRLAGELVDFDAPVDIELSIFYPLCIEVLIRNRECEKALRLVDQLLVFLKDAHGGYKANMLFLRAWASQGRNTGEDPLSAPEMDVLVEPLTQRELEILRLLKSHLPAPEIADLLALSVNTVRTHIKSVYAKLGVHDRTAAIDVSQKLRLLA